MPIPKRLTDARVRDAEPGKTRQRIRDGLSELYLQIEPAPRGTKSYIVRFRPSPASPQILRTIGPVSEFTLDHARLRAADIVRDARRAPAAPTPARRTGKTWREAIDDYEAVKASDMRSGAEVLRQLRRDCAAWNEIPLKSLSGRDDVTPLLDRRYREAPVAANRLVTRLKTVGRWLVSRHELDVSPFERLELRFAEPERDVALTLRQLAAVWKGAEALGSPWSTVFQLLILTACRREEVGSGTWEEIDFAAGVWTIPEGRMKAGRAHRIPITPAIAAVLEKAPRTSRWLAPARGVDAPVSGWSDAVERLRVEAQRFTEEPMPKWTAHDLRRSFATAIVEPPFDVEPYIADRILAHAAPEGALSRRYIRSDMIDRRAAAMTMWSDAILAAVAELPELEPTRKAAIEAAARDTTLTASAAGRRAGCSEAAIRKARIRLGV